MRRKILTLEDLETFCEVSTINRFSSSESGYQICVQVPARFEKVESSDDTILFANVLVMHTGINLNKSCLTQEAAEKAIKDLPYKPVLANFCEIDGVRDFTGHDFEYDDEDNVIYYEKQIGCFTSDPAYMEDDEAVEGRKNIFAKVAIPRNYTDAADIIERKGGTYCSVELGVNELSWSKETGTLNLDDVTIWGLTCLGVDSDTGRKIMPGMENAHIQIEDFSKENNSLVFNKTKLVEEITNAVIERLEFDRKGDENMKKRKDGVEEVDAEMKAFDQEADAESAAQEGEALEPETVDEEPDAKGEEPSEENADESDADNGEGNFCKTFELSHEDVRYGLYQLLVPYENADNEIYMIVEVYDDRFVYEGWLNANDLFQQGYKKDGDTISFEGERVHMNRMILTDEEFAQIKEMRQNYSSISDKLSKYEEEPQKMEILNSKDYAALSGRKEFEDLKVRENHFDMSVDDVKEKADSILLKYAKAGLFTFSGEESNEEEIQKKDFFAFAKINEDTSFLDGLLKK